MYDCVFCKIYRKMRVGEVGVFNSDILMDKVDDDVDVCLLERCVLFFFYKFDCIIVCGKVIKFFYFCVYFLVFDW